ncbi:MAG: MFS transporter [Chloroflexi bacterium]|nr:MFS transporter [Chloroflexota bacterium]
MSLLLNSLFASVALGHLMVDTFNSSRPVLLTYLGLSETEIALISTIYIWASALSQPFFGWVSDRIGPRWLASGGVLWMTVFYSLALFLPGDEGLICLIVAALGSAAFHPVGAVQATLQGRDHLKGREATAASLFFTSGQVGHFIGPIVTGLILAKLQAPGLFIFSAVAIPIGFTLAVQLSANKPHPYPAQKSKNSPRLQATSWAILALIVVATLQSWAQSNIVNLMPKYFKDMGLTAAVYGNMAGLFMGGSALGNFIGGYLGDRNNKKFVVSTALLLASIPIFIMSKIGWSDWLYLLIPLSGMFTGAVFSIIVVLAQRLLPGGMALASGLALGFIFSSGALGMLLTGPMAETQGFPSVLVLSSGLVLVGAMFALMLPKEQLPINR